MEEEEEEEEGRTTTTVMVPQTRLNYISYRLHTARHHGNLKPVLTHNVNKNHRYEVLGWMDAPVMDGCLRD